MKISGLLKVLAILSLVVDSALAADVTYSVQQTALHYSSENTTTTPKAGSDSSSKSSALTTMPNTFTVSVLADKISFYLYPTQAGSPFAIGYYISPAIEVGMNLKIETSKIEDVTGSSHHVGPFLNYYHEMGCVQLEGYGALSYGVDKSEETSVTDGVSTTNKIETSGTSVYAGALFLVPITKTYLYGAGLSAQLDNSKEKTSELKTGVLTTMIHLAVFRANF